MLDPTRAAPSAFAVHLGEKPNHSSANGTKIAVQNVDFFYGEKHALKDVAIDIFEREVTAFIGLTLAECIAAVGTPDDFAGMVAEDRYTVVTYGEGDALLNQIMTQLQRGLLTFYGFREREQGYLILNSGTSTEERVGLMRAVIHKSTAQSASATA